MVFSLYERSADFSIDFSIDIKKEALRGFPQQLLGIDRFIWLALSVRLIVLLCYSPTGAGFTG